MRNNSKFLVLALDFRKLSNELIRFVEEGTMSQDFAISLASLIASLVGAKERTSVQALHDRGRFGNYENVMTLNEVVDSNDMDLLIQKIRAILQEEDVSAVRENALQAISFFDALERRALFHYNNPRIESRQAVTQ